jgi:rRNA maturation endonuclease Nob1
LFIPFEVGSIALFLVIVICIALVIYELFFHHKYCIVCRKRAATGWDLTCKYCGGELKETDETGAPERGDG